jgi:ABC-type lipoprotein export system ATPase subunit
MALVFAPHSTAKGIGLFAAGVCRNKSDIARSQFIAGFDVFGSAGAEVLKNPRSEFGSVPPRWFISGDTRSLTDIGSRAVYLKLGSQPTLEGLRQAFLMPHTRIRFPVGLQKQWGHVTGIRFLSSTAPSWPRITRIEIRGGFHSDLSLDFAPGLNAIIGGKGTGKSTLLEILRYVLEADPPLTDEATGHRKHNFRANAEAAIRFVDGNGDEYEIRRSGDDTPSRLLRGGRETEVSVRRRIKVRMFGQRELQQLAKRKDVRRAFVASQAGLEWEQAEAAEREHLASLELVGTNLTSLETSLARLDENAHELADIRDRLTLAEEKGLAQLIQESQQLGRIDRSVKLLAAWPGQVGQTVERLANNVPAPALPSHPLMPEGLAAAVTDLEAAVTGAVGELRTRIADASARLDPLATAWGEIHTAERHRIQAALAEGGIADPAELDALQRRATELESLVADQPTQQTRHSELVTNRRELLDRLNETRRRKSRLVEEASRSLTHRVGARVRLVVNPMGDRSLLEAALEDALKRQGIRREQLQRLSLTAPGVLADALRAGQAAVEALGCSASTASKLVALSASVFRQLEEIDVPDDISVEMDLGSPDDETWTDIDAVSPGQQATAVLALALASGSEPLIIDQPEDDLDNRHIYDEVVKVLGEICQSKQVIVATHNANIPVLGDAELIVALDAGAGRSNLLACGGLEVPKVAEEARHILEGGDEAFRARHRRYLAATG